MAKSNEIAANVTAETSNFEAGMKRVAKAARAVEDEVTKAFRAAQSEYALEQRAESMMRGQKGIANAIQKMAAAESSSIALAGEQAAVPFAAGFSRRFGGKSGNLFGKRGPVKDALELLRGGGQIAAFGYGIREVDRFGEKLASLNQEWAQTSTTMRDMVADAAHAIPVAGDLATQLEKVYYAVGQLGARAIWGTNETMRMAEMEIANLATADKYTRAMAEQGKAEDARAAKQSKADADNERWWKLRLEYADNTAEALERIADETYELEHGPRAALERSLQKEVDAGKLAAEVVEQRMALYDKASAAAAREAEQAYDIARANQLANEQAEAWARLSEDRQDDANAFIDAGKTQVQLTEEHLSRFKELLAEGYFGAFTGDEITNALAEIMRGGRVSGAGGNRPAPSADARTAEGMSLLNEIKGAARPGEDMQREANKLLKEMLKEIAAGNRDAATLLQEIGGEPVGV